MHRAKLLLLFVCFFVSNLLTWMVFRHFENKIQGHTKQVPKFSAVIYSFGQNTILPLLHKCGVYHVDTVYYNDQSPIFHVSFGSESCLKKFLLEIGDVKFTMEVARASVNAF